jgi:hypothetical protein
MALPKISTPTFECELPSTKEKILYRPFLVKEEKVLLIAKESGEKIDIYNAIKTIVNNCVLKEDFNVNTLPVFDMEYLFIQIRSVSVGNVVKFKVQDSTDGIEYDLELDLNDVVVQFSEDHSNKIMITDDIGITLKYPTPAMSDAMVKVENMVDLTDKMLDACIDTIYDEDDVYSWKQESKKNKQEFIDMLPIDAYNKIQKFFETSPKIEHIVNYTNSEGTEKRVVFRDLDDFFQLG